MITETGGRHRPYRIKKDKRAEMMKHIKDINIAETRKKIRRPLIRLIFSRIGVIGIILLLQALILLSVFKWMGDYSKAFMEACTAFSVIQAFMGDNSGCIACHGNFALSVYSF